MARSVRRRYEAGRTLDDEPAVFDNAAITPRRTSSMLARCKSDDDAQALARAMNRTRGAKIWVFEQVLRRLGRQIVRALRLSR